MNQTKIHNDTNTGVYHLSLGTFVYRELVHQTYHPKLKDAIIVLLAALKFNNKAVAQVILCMYNVNVQPLSALY